MPYFTNLLKRCVSKFYFSAKNMFGKFVDELDGGNSQYQNNFTENTPEKNYEKPVSENKNKSYGSVPFMITRNMKMDLMDMGYSMKDIKDMTPYQANEILKKKD